MINASQLVQALKMGLLFKSIYSTQIRFRILVEAAYQSREMIQY
jgi:hypothetical protein